MALARAGSRPPPPHSNSANPQAPQTTQSPHSTHSAQANFNANSFDEKQIKELALIAFSIKKYAQKLLAENALQGKARPLQSSVSRLENFLAQNAVQVLDYAGQHYNEGMNVEIIDTIRLAPTALCAQNSQNAPTANTAQSTLATPFVAECIEPSVIYRGQLLHKARIIKAICDEGGENSQNASTTQGTSGENSHSANENSRETGKNSQENSQNADTQNANSQISNLNSQNSKNSNPNSNLKTINSQTKNSQSIFKNFSKKLANLRINSPKKDTK